MLLLDVVIFLSLAICVTAHTTAEDKPKEESSVNDSYGFNELIDSLGFEPKQKKVLKNIFKKGKKDWDITLIGWQNIHDEEGNLKEINTLELVIPSQYEKEEDDDELELEDYEAFIDEVKGVQSTFLRTKSSAANLDLKYYDEAYDSEGEEIYQVVVGRDEMYASWEGAQSLYNKTIRNAKPEETEAFIKYHRNKHTYDISVLRYDEDGSFIPERSNVVPVLTVTVESTQDDVPVDTVDKVSKVIADISAKYLTGDITDEILDFLTKEMPEYNWGVIESPDSYHVTKDFGLYVTYDPFELDTRSEYYIYAHKKE